MDDYHDEYWGQNSQTYYPDTYSLWDSSQYYNTNLLSPRNSFRDEDLPQQPVELTQTRDVRDSKNRRIILRDWFNETPDPYWLRTTENEADTPQETMEPQNVEETNNDWTNNYWRKASQSATSDIDSNVANWTAVNNKNKAVAQRINKQNKLGKKLMVGLSKPVKLSKAESMMQKMGWEGGALGKAGNGIVEPIAPNVAYATKTIGLGHGNETKKKQKQNVNPKPKPAKQLTKAQKREIFITNALLFILDFVCSDWEVELVFDDKLTSAERRLIHRFVNNVINEDDETEDDGPKMKITELQMDILKRIDEHNYYILRTESKGAMPFRKLYLYKESPEYVYVVTPDDLRENSDWDDIVEVSDTEDEKSQPENEKSTSENTKNEKSSNVNSKIKKSLEKNVNTVSEIKDDELTDNEENPFLKSITKNLKNYEMKSDELNDDDNEMVIEKKDDEFSIEKLLIDFFKEFVDEDIYTEFRFLGPFNEEECEELNKLLNDISDCINDSDIIRNEEILKAINNEKYTFEIMENYNGSMVVHKIKKGAET